MPEKNLFEEIFKYTAIVIGGCGGIGGVAFLIKLYVGRIRVTAKIVSESSISPELVAESALRQCVTIKVEFINYGDKATSLEKEMVVKAVDIKGAKEVFIFQLNSEQIRKIEPHNPTTLRFIQKKEYNSYPFSWFRVYRFKLSRGSIDAIYKINASNQNKVNVSNRT